LIREVRRFGLYFRSGRFFLPLSERLENIQPVIWTEFLENYPAYPNVRSDVWSDAKQMSGRCDCHLSPADFDHAYDLAKRLTRSNNAKEHFEYNRHFWDSIFSKAKRPILREVLHQLEDRGTRYEPLLLKLFPPETRPRRREVLIEMYRKGKIAEAFRAFKKIYLEIVDEVIDHLQGQEAGHSVR
jgi:hypothetical protein